VRALCLIICLGSLEFFLVPLSLLVFACLCLSLLISACLWFSPSSDWYRMSGLFVFVERGEVLADASI
jgi:hypothetical protein